MTGLILAAGRSQRMQDLTTHRNKVLLDLGGKSILDNVLDQFAAAGIAQTYVTVGFDGATVRRECRNKATPILNPFYEQYGILSSLWVARGDVYASPLLITVGDHYFESDALRTFLQHDPNAPIAVHVEAKKCDDEDMKVFIDQRHELLTISKTWPAFDERGRSANAMAVGEFTGMIRLTAAGCRTFFDTLQEFVWQKGLRDGTYMADILMACHRREQLSFCLSHDHRRLDIDFPRDYDRARELYASRPADTHVEPISSVMGESAAAVTNSFEEAA